MSTFCPENAEAHWLTVSRFFSYFYPGGCYNEQSPLWWELGVELKVSHPIVSRPASQLVPEELRHSSLWGAFHFASLLLYITKQIVN